jgi:argininosuccinate lyase
MSDQQLIAIHPKLTKDVKNYLNVNGAVASRSSSMGTAKNSVSAAISSLNKETSKVDERISNLRKQFSGMITP